MNNVIIFGASKLGEVAYHILKEKYNICFFSDNDSNKWGKLFCGIQIVNPNEISKYKFYRVIIASMYYSEISVQLEQNGIGDIYLFTCLNIDEKLSDKIYSVDKICNSQNYKNIILDADNNCKYIKDFSLIYNKSKRKNDELKVLKNDKKILIIAYIFPPIGGAGVQRTLKFVKYLKELGYDPTVITVGSDYINEKKDYSLLKEIPQNTKIIRIDHSKFNSEQLSREDIEQIIKLLYGISDNENTINSFINLLTRNRAEFLTPDCMISWVNEVLKKIEELINIDEYKCVYTTSSPYSIHIAGFYLKNKYGIKWIADFRDEWHNNPYAKVENSTISELEFQIENSIVNTADTVIQVTPISTENCIKIFNLEKSKVKTITNGYDENDFYDIDNNQNRNNKKFIIQYSGVLYDNRLPDNFIYAFNELIEEEKIKKDLIEIVLYGKASDKIENKIKKLDKYNLIKCYGYLNHKDCIKENSKSNLLYLPVGEGEKFKGIYTGKVFEYIRLQIPILALAPNNGVVAELLRKTGTGVTVEYDNINSMKVFILEQYNLWISGKYKSDYNFDEIKKYNREYLTSKLIKIIES